MAKQEEKLRKRIDEFGNVQILPFRKKFYVVWWWYLHLAEEKDEFTVRWDRYKKWGSRDEVMNTKFDDWWETHWTLFSTENDNKPPEFQINSSRPDFSGLRTQYWIYKFEQKGLKKISALKRFVEHTDKRLVYLKTNHPYDPENYENYKKSKHYKHKKPFIYFEYKQMMKDLGVGHNAEGHSISEKTPIISREVRRYFTKAKLVLNAVCEGRFPK